MKNKISIITPCFNSEKFIMETMLSVFLQTAFFRKKAELEYIIVDGNSTDNTQSIIEDTIKKYKKENFKITFISEKDNGMYDALAKGLRLVSGNICAYINSDDFYNPHAFETVLDVMDNLENEWITGINVHYNETSAITWTSQPYNYRRNLIQKGIYGEKLPFIQQESTFWKENLNQNINLEKLKKLKYAGDYYIWYELSKQTELKIIQSVLSGFRIRKGQLSSDLLAYRKEVESFVEKKFSMFDWGIIALDKILWHFPGFNKKIIRYNHDLQKWI